MATALTVSLWLEAERLLEGRQGRIADVRLCEATRDFAPISIALSGSLGTRKRPLMQASG